MNLKEIAKQIVEQGELANAMQEALFYHTVNGRLTAEALIKYVSQFEKQAQKLAPNAPVRYEVSKLSGYYPSRHHFWAKLNNLLPEYGLKYGNKLNTENLQGNIIERYELFTYDNLDVENSVLCVNCYQTEGGNWEVVCYLS